MATLFRARAAPPPQNRTCFTVFLGLGEGDDVPVNFDNALGPLDGRGGLLRGVFYKALAQ